MRTGPIFALALLIALAATFPMRLAAALLPGPALSADAIEGSIWSAEARNARLGPLGLGDARLALDPLGLATGGLRLRIEANGEVAGRGALVVRGEDRGVDDVDAAVPIGFLRLALPLSGALFFTDFAAEFGPDGCRRAAGSIGTDALRASGAALQWQGPDLVGQAACAADGALEAVMVGADAASNVRASLRIMADGRYTLDTVIASGDPTVGAALPLAGFVAGPDGFARRDEGTIADDLSS